MTKEQIFAALAVCTDKQTLARVADVLNHKDTESGKKPEAEARLITQSEAAKRLGVSVTTIWRLIKDECIEAKNVRGKRRVVLASLLRYAGVGN